MSKNAKIAVITRTKNRPITLKRAISSVAAQTFGDYVHVIVNDGGSPDTVEKLVDSGGNKRKTVILHNRESLGMEAASNTGIRSCESDYILIHDDDDSLYPEFLEKTLSFLEAHSSLFCGVSSWITLVKESLGEDEIVRISENLYNNFRTVDIGRMAIFNRLVPIAFLYKRQLHEDIGYYDETLPVMGDWDFFLRALEKHDIGILPEELAFYHQRVSGEGVYANSLTVTSKEHVFYTQIIKNRMFRREMEIGQAGIGLLSQMSSIIHTLFANPIDHYVKSVAAQILVNRPKNTAIYGTGDIGKLLFGEIRSTGVDVVCFIENQANLKKKPASFMGLPVVSLEEAISNGFLDIAIGSWEHKKTIIDRIHKKVDVNKHRLRLYSA